MTSSGGDEAKISIIIPVLNEGDKLEGTLKSLQVYRQKGHEIVLVDGGSNDNSIGISIRYVDKLIQTIPGRGRQMNEGVEASRHSILLFLHGDTQLPENADLAILRALRPVENIWGRFNLRLSGSGIIFRLIESTINLRTFISGIATGDQAIFVTREMFEEVRYYDPIPLMEDVALSKKLLKYAQPCCLSEKVLSSSRRWEENGIVKTIMLMWCLRVAYFFGAKPAKLVSLYYKPTDSS